METGRPNLLVPVRHRLDHHQVQLGAYRHPREHDALAEMLNTCPNRPTLLAGEPNQGGQRPNTTSSPARPTATPVPSTATPTTRTYSSCDAAQAVGETRVQGSKGAGRGFPKLMVPSARDGDGVVCER